MGPVVRPVRPLRPPATASTAANFSVVRVKRDILRRSTVGLLATNRSPAVAGQGSNQVYGLDSSLAFCHGAINSGATAPARSGSVRLSVDDRDAEGGLDHGRDPRADGRAHEAVRGPRAELSPVDPATEPRRFQPARRDVLDHRYRVAAENTVRRRVATPRGPSKAGGVFTECPRHLASRPNPFLRRPKAG